MFPLLLGADMAPKDKALQAPAFVGNASFSVQMAAKRTVEPTDTSTLVEALKVGTIKLVQTFCRPIPGTNKQECRDVTTSMCPPTVSGTRGDQQVICDTENCKMLSDNECDCDIDYASCKPVF